MMNELNVSEIRFIEEYFDLSEGKECPLALWIIGRPAAGKTTTAALLKDALYRAGYRVELVDADDVRLIFNRALGFSVTDRLTALKKYVHLNQILQSRGIIPITAANGGFRKFRDNVRRNLKNPRFIYLDCPFDVAAQRDQKGLYKKALAGELRNFFGIDIRFEPPIECQMKIDSSNLKPSEIIAQIMENLDHNGLL